ncbi:hypothetical protein FKP32DRAFT_1671606 [Trametes sanguinea]|nr:hypothetical protein FKP32DRAFT_1671606 [Trametes sanguinea]
MWGVSLVPWDTVTPLALAIVTRSTGVLAVLLPPSFAHAAAACISTLKAVVREWLGVDVLDSATCPAPPTATLFGLGALP